MRSVLLQSQASWLTTHSSCAYMLTKNTDSAAAMNGDVSGRYVGRDPSCSEVFDMVRSWIGECSGHPNCNQTLSGMADSDCQQTLLPSRTIKIQKDGRLSLSENNDARGAYATATHRWNEETERCKTTMDNYKARSEGAGLEPLPQLFNDMITIAQRLGIHHVWIDSLCIIQSGDDGADWTKEARKMAQNYQHSVITVAGTIPMSTANDSILHPFPDSSLPWASSNLVRLPYLDPSHTPAGHFFVFKRQTALINDYFASVRHTAILKRGWILQEWLLSRRILWYTPSGVFFECRGEMPRTPNHEKIRLEVAPTEFRASLEMKPAFHHTNPDIIEFWYRAVEVYSGCELTQPEKDRILAVAGLARGVYEILVARRRRVDRSSREGFMILAGVWAHDLCHGLLWQENQLEGEQRGVRVDAAPSWSWTPIMGRLVWPERGEGITTHALTVVGALLSKPTLRGTRPEMWYPSLPLKFDPTNSFACLHLRGRLYPVHVRGYFKDEDLERVKVATGYGTTHPASSRWRAICSLKKPEVVAGWASMEFLGEETGRCADGGVAVHALHVSTRYLQTGWLNRRAGPVLAVLLLEEDEESGAYRRLGVGRILDGGLIQEMMDAAEEFIHLL